MSLSIYLVVFLYGFQLFYVLPKPVTQFFFGVYNFYYKKSTQCYYKFAGINFRINLPENF